MIQKFLNIINEVSSFVIKQNTVDYYNVNYSSDETLFFQLKINDYNIYLEHFFDINDEETILNIWRDNHNIFAYGGTLDECLTRINIVVNE